jgi:hypothetical protein
MACRESLLCSAECMPAESVEKKQSGSLKALYVGCYSNGFPTTLRPAFPQFVLQEASLKAPA